MRLVIAEDSVLLREGIIRLLTDSGFEVVAAVGDGPSLVEAVVEHRPRISIVDVRMPPSFRDEGLRAAIAARRRRGNLLEELTPREHEVLALMAEGRSNSSIAESLSVSDGAVEKHVSNIFSKLGLPPADATHRRVLAVLTYLRS